MSCLCDQCAALCCRYFALPIDNPDTPRAFDDIRWYLIHQNVVVFIESKQWYVGVLNKCRHLQDDNRCGIYETRPKICREYTTDNCDYHGGEYDFEQLFTSAEQLQEYANTWLAEQRAKKRRAAKKRDEKAKAGLNGKSATSATSSAGSKTTRKSAASKRKAGATRKFGRGPILVSLPPGTTRRPQPSPAAVPSRNGRGVSLPLLNR